MTRIGYVARGAMRGKTLGRLLCDECIEKRCATLAGKVLDLGGGISPGYLKRLPRHIELVRTDLHAAEGVTAVDFNESLPFQDESFDAVLLFNAIYAADDERALLREIGRVVKKNGTFVLLSPFVANEMKEPHDYVRYTAEGLERLVRAAGFGDVSIDRIGERASAATNILHPFLLSNPIRAAAFALAVLLDRAIPRAVRAEHPAPISYLLRCTKR